MNSPAPELPDSVLNHIRLIFAECKRRAAMKMSRLPTTHETALDLSIIECLSELGTPQRINGDWIVRLDAHYLGGGRHFGEWEIADIGFIVVIRERGSVRLRKIALLQSKRLYPNEQNLEEDTPLDYAIGFARLMPGDVSALEAEEQRLFTFATSSRYRMLRVGDHQYHHIEEYEWHHQVPVHYLLHHPLELPWQQTIPLAANARVNAIECSLGATVARSRDIRSSLEEHEPNYCPSFADLSRLGWPLEEFVAGELLKCREGFVAQGPDDGGLYQIFNRRSGPLAASVAIVIDHVGGAEKL